MVGWVVVVVVGGERGEWGWVGGCVCAWGGGGPDMHEHRQQCGLLRLVPWPLLDI